MVRRTAHLNQGVQDVLTIQPPATSVLVGQKVTFTGTVIPDKSGQTIYLEQLGKDGRWHTIQIGEVRRGSTYLFRWKSGVPGQFTFRTHILSGGHNVGARSGSAMVTVTVPPPTSG